MPDGSVDDRIAGDVGGGWTGGHEGRCRERQYERIHEDFVGGCEDGPASTAASRYNGAGRQRCKDGEADLADGVLVRGDRMRRAERCDGCGEAMETFGQGLDGDWGGAVVP